MKFKIKGYDYQLEFGMKFIHEMDKRYRVSRGGIEFGMGVNMAYMSLNMMNPAALQDIISASLSHEESKPSFKAIEDAIVEYANDNDGLEGLFEEFQEALGNEPLLKATIKNFQKNAAVEQAKEMEEVEEE